MAKDARPQLSGGKVRTGRSPGHLFAEIRSRFLEWGILGNCLSLEYRGATYRISCDEKAFMVYRVNTGSASRHHVPGWPVCLVSSDLMFEECGSAGFADDHYSCDLDIDSWVALVSRHCRGL